jgi:hypothetical protein
MSVSVSVSVTLESSTVVSFSPAVSVQVGALLSMVAGGVVSFS